MRNRQPAWRAQTNERKRKPSKGPARKEFKCREGLGKYTTSRAELKFRNEAVVPKFFRARPVPIALRPKVEAKMEEMVRNGTIKRVEHSKWAGVPLVVVPKPGGKIRICGDYKVTVNPQLDINQYPLPKPDDLFHMLHGGKKFSKVDLSDAYMQVELEESSRDYHQHA
ncbi:unnamed protein product [Haemonchus placei]|uniref:Reverse transcriptase domain-containing protein n=1 Tax=Haemonchus placei TaxID=6290 RepID=A0A0N4XAJ5_HAEPC|nr:unnamed protein product [Haemonchus placei]